tara:strand:+ start:1761 stop:2045 length:285 start_codon:yes stop_codon:yes gene_type:complete
MNMKDARKLKPGAIVREAWLPDSKVQGIVLSKELYVGEHYAKCLCQKKKQRFDVTVHWLGDDKTIPKKKWSDNNPPRVQVRENWELMIISHAPS